MDRRSLLEMMGTAALGGVLVASGALAQQKPIKDQLVGAWTLLLDDGVKADGTQIPIFGPNPVGSLIFTPKRTILAADHARCEPRSVCLEQPRQRDG